jgi:hypothetical protein
MLASKNWMRRVTLGCVLVVLLGWIPSSASAETCDLRKEILALIISIDRYVSTATEAVTLRRVPIANALNAKFDFEAQRTRLGYLCRAELRSDSSAAREIGNLAWQQANAMDLMLLGRHDKASIKSGGDAGLKLIELAAKYFDTPSR